MNTNDKTPERDEIEMLLPWHAAGTLSTSDAEKVERALSQDPELARHFGLAREELGEAVHLNETLGTPSARAFDKLFAAIDAESPQTKRQTSFDLAGWISGFLAQFSPRTLAWSAGAAALAIVLQAGLLAGLYVSERSGSGMGLASRDTVVTGQGAYVLVSFNPTASTATVTQFLKDNGASVVDGPRENGMYRVRVAPIALPPEALARVAARLQQETGVITLALPTK